MRSQKMGVTPAADDLSNCGGECDGLEENIVLLNRLSEKLEQYFAMRTLGGPF